MVLTSAAVFDYGQVLTKMSPLFGGAGTLVTLSGGNFGGSSSTVVASFGTTTVDASHACSTTVMSNCHTPTTVKVKAPTGISGKQPVSVTVNTAAADVLAESAAFDYGQMVTG